MPRWATLTLCVATSLFLGWAVALSRLYEALSPFLSALSIMAAGVLVRLNRTMPSLEWKNVEPSAREKLTAQIVALAREYVVLLAMIAGVGLFTLALIVVGADAATGKVVEGLADPVGGWPRLVQRIVVGVLGGLTTLIFVRMGYVVWRDYDIICLQSVVINEAAKKAQDEEQVARAEQARATAAKANLRALPTPPPKAWDE